MRPTPMKNKDLEREEIARLTEEFLARGGVIQRCAYGESGIDKNKPDHDRYDASNSPE